MPRRAAPPTGAAGSGASGPPPSSEASKTAPASEEKLAIGRRIARARKARGLASQVAAARALDVSEQLYSQWEAGTCTPRVPDNLRSVCDFFGVTADWILFGRTPGMAAEVVAALYPPPKRRKRAKKPEIG